MIAQALIPKFLRGAKELEQHRGAGGRKNFDPAAGAGLRRRTCKGPHLPAGASRVSGYQMPRWRSR